MTALAAQVERRPHTLTIPAGLILLALAVMAVVASGSGDVSSQVRARSIGAVFVGVAGAVLTSHDRGLVRTLAAGKVGPWASLSFALVFGLGSLPWAETRQTGFSAIIAPVTVAVALELLCWAWAAWIVGYSIGALRALRSPVVWALDLAIPRATAARMWPARGVWLLFGVSLFGVLLTALTNRFGYVQDASLAASSYSSFGQLASVLANMGLFAVIVAAVRYFSGRGSALPLMTVGSAQVLISLLQGSKEGTAVVVVAVVLSYALVRRRVPFRALLVGIVLFTFVVLPLVTSYRAAVRGPSGSTIGVSAAVRKLPAIAASTVSQAAYADSLEKLQMRLRGIDSLSVVMQQSPEAVAYEPLSGLLVEPVIGLVPRVLWPGKPGFIGGLEFGRVYYGAPAGFYSSWAVTPPADLYRRGGALVLVLGMLAFGGLYRLFDDVLSPERDPRHLFLVVVLFPIFVKHEAEIGSILLSLPVSVLGAAIAVRALGLVGGEDALEGDLPS